MLHRHHTPAPAGRITAASARPLPRSPHRHPVAMAALHALIAWLLLAPPPAAALTLATTPWNPLERVYRHTLPDSTGSTLRLAAAPGEYEPASFILRSDSPLRGVRCVATDLVGELTGARIPADSLDLRYVMNQAVDPYYGGHRMHWVVRTARYGFYHSGDRFRFFVQTVKDPIDTLYTGYKEIGFNDLKPDVWHEYVGTFGDGYITLYVDGEVQSRTPWHGTIESASSPITFGAYYEQQSEFMVGRMDRVGISSGFHPPAQGTPPDSVWDMGLWEFDEGSGTIAHDASPAALDATLSGSAGWIAHDTGYALDLDGHGSAGTDWRLLDPGDSLTVRVAIQPTHTIAETLPRVLLDMADYQQILDGEISADESHWFWVTAHAAATAPPDHYHGRLHIYARGDSTASHLAAPSGNHIAAAPHGPGIQQHPVHQAVLPAAQPLATLDLQLDLRDLDLIQPPEPTNSVFFSRPDCFTDPDSNAWLFDLQMQDLHRHGFSCSGITPPTFSFAGDDTMTLEVDFTPLDDFMEHFMSVEQAVPLTYYDLFSNEAHRIRCLIEDSSNCWDDPYWNFTTQFDSLFVQAVRATRDHWAEHPQWPELIGEIWDEPTSHNHTGDALHLLHLLRPEGVVGITHIADNDSSRVLFPQLDIGLLLWHEIDSTYLAEIVAYQDPEDHHRIEPWVYNLGRFWDCWARTGLERFAYGFFFDRLWRDYGVAANVEFKYNNLAPKNRWGESVDPLSYYRSFAVPRYCSPALPSPHGPVPTVPWEWMREGNDDLRYLRTAEELAAFGADSDQPDISAAVVAANQAIDAVEAAIPDTLDYAAIIDPDDPLLWPAADYDRHRQQLATAAEKLSTWLRLGIWDLDEGAGTIAHDASPYSHDGTLDACTWVPGVRGEALRFIQNSGGVTVTAAPPLQTGRGLTLAAWVLAEPLGPQQMRGRVIEKPSAYGLYREQNEVVFYVDTSAGGGARRELHWPLNEGKWVHLAGCYDGHEMTLYVDAKWCTATPQNGAIRHLADPLFLGYGGPDQPREEFAGVIDEVRIRAYPTSTSAVAALRAGIH